MLVDISSNPPLCQVTMLSLRAVEEKIEFEHWRIFADQASAAPQDGSEGRRGQRSPLQAHSGTGIALAPVGSPGPTAVENARCSTVFWRKISFFFNDTATTEIYTLSLHDALPI